MYRKWYLKVADSIECCRFEMKNLVLLFFQEVWVVSASAPQLPLQIEDAMRNEEAEVTDAEGGLRVRVNQVRCLLSAFETISSSPIFNTI